MVQPNIISLSNSRNQARMLVIRDCGGKYPVFIVAVNEYNGMWYFYDYERESGRRIGQIGTDDDSTARAMLLSLYEERVENKQPIAQGDAKSDGLNKTPAIH